jgi:uncharacterized repeat protein (TIGR01451 family)
MHIDCSDNNFDEDISLAHGATHTVNNIPVGTTCLVTETVATAPVGYIYGTPAITPMVTISEAKTATIEVLNPLKAVVIKTTATDRFDLALIKKLKSGSKTRYSVGEKVLFTITVLNQGELNATEIQLNDYIPAGLILDDANWVANGGVATLLTPIAKLESKMSTTVDIGFTIDSKFEGRTITNNAEIASAKGGVDIDSNPSSENNSSNPDSNDNDVNDKLGGDDYDPATIEVKQLFDLALKKNLAEGQASTVKAGDAVDFTITLYNQGSVTAHDIDVIDYIPTGMGLIKPIVEDEGNKTAPNPTDMDNDGISNEDDSDDDNDKISDEIENQGTVDLDSDRDGIPNRLDLDSDNDGLPDALEGIADVDGDGLPNFLDLDSDGDGLPDTFEGNFEIIDGDNDGIVGTGTPKDNDGDGLANSNDPDWAGNVLDGYGYNQDRDGDGVPNYLDIDIDNDGIVDNIEGQSTFNYVAPTGDDSDGDGIDDAYDVDEGAKVIGYTNADGGSAPDYADIDSDNDGIKDIVEAGGDDADNNGMADNFSDTDGDGLADEFDADAGPTNGQTPESFPDVDETGGDLDWRSNSDEDGDGVPNINDIDDDNDGILDSDEDANEDGDNNPLTMSTDYDRDGIPNYLDLDTDGDGIADITEAGGEDADGDGHPGVGYVKTDVDANGLPSILNGVPISLNDPLDDFDADGTPNWLDLDSDDDGIYDVIEAGGTDENGDGIYGIGILNDEDADGLADAVDPKNDLTTSTVAVGTPLILPDSDSDGVLDIYDLDSDDDGTPDMFDPSSTDAAKTGEIATENANKTFLANHKNGRFTVDTLVAGDSVSFDFRLYVDANFTGETIRNWAEISDASNKKGGETTSDVDSTPDSIPFNGTGESDDMTDNDVVDENGKNGADEDDHDAEEIRVEKEVGSLSGNVSHENSEGLHPLKDVTLILYDVNGTEVARTTTDKDGNYRFTNLPPADYLVKELQPKSYFDVRENEGGLDDDNSTTTLTNVISATVGSGENDIQNDFVEAESASLGDYVWYDNNKDGVQDGSEFGVKNIKVYLLDENGDRVPNISTETNATGGYIFEGLNPLKEYAVEFDLSTLASDYVVTSRDSEFDNTKDSDADTTTGKTASAQMEAGKHYPDLDMGIHLNLVDKYRIGTLFWIDSNRDGKYNNNEEVIPNAKVELLDANSMSVLDVNGDSISIQTNEKGEYHFDVLEGTYNVRFNIPESLKVQGYEFGERMTDNGDELNRANASGITIPVAVGSNVNGQLKSQDLTLDAAINHTIVAGLTDSNCSCDTYESEDTIPSLNYMALLFLFMLSSLFAFFNLKKVISRQ